MKLLFLMLSLLPSNRYVPSRPRLGKKPSGRRLARLVFLVTSVAFIVVATLTIVNSQILSSHNSGNKLLLSISEESNSNHREYTDSVLLEKAIPATIKDQIILPTSKKNNSFQVQFVSNNQLEMAQLQKKITQNQNYYEQQKSTENTSFEKSSIESQYINSIEQIIVKRGNQRYQRLFGSSGLRGDAKVQIDINKNGNIHNLYIIISSGIKKTDDEIIASIREAAPFPPVPKSIVQFAEYISISRWVSFAKK